MSESETLTTFEVASSIRKWAVQKGLLQPMPEAIEANNTADVEALRGGHDMESLLRAKGLHSIAYNEPARSIFIYTKRKVFQKDLKILPGSIQGCGIAYPHGGIDDIGKSPATAQGAPYRIVQVANGNHYACGSSVSPGNSATAGTLGALVVDDTGSLFGLTNNHVTGLCNHSPLGIPILAPGVLDVGPNGLNPFTIGLHARVLDMNVGTQGNIDITRNSDAATFRIIAPELVSSSQGGFYDTPTTVSDPIEGMLVEKVGRTTGRTQGRIVGRELMPAGIHYTAAEYGFSGCMYFMNVWIVHGLDDIFSSGGDSGSLIVSIAENGERSAVGLLFAGGPDASAPGEKRTLFLPIRQILDQLQVRLVGGHHVSRDS